MSMEGGNCPMEAVGGTGAGGGLGVGLVFVSMGSAAFASSIVMASRLFPTIAMSSWGAAADILKESTVPLLGGSCLQVEPESVLVSCSVVPRCDLSACGTKWEWEPEGEIGRRQ